MARSDVRHERPDPDELLKQVLAEGEKAGRGRLKIFLGASAGVGKTHTMLAEAQEQRRSGVDVVAGYVEGHGRSQTDALLEGLEAIPLNEIEHRGVRLNEFNLDAALQRRPKLILIDEYAHTNATGSRHPKRYQDVEELLGAGIDVYSTMNIQHLESLNDVVAQITGVMVRETVPDSALDRADEVVLVDIPPKELRQRLREGKVYVPERVDHALDGFFREGNLTALRELALRRTADQVDAQMQRYRAEKKVSDVWPAKERILVCIAPNRLGLRVVRSAARIGAVSHAEMIALTVESDRQVDRSSEDLLRAQSALRLAERLGMNSVTASGHDIVAVILKVAKERNANLIVVGKPVKPRWKEILHGSVVDELVRRSGDIDVHVITREEQAVSGRRIRPRRQTMSWIGPIAALLVTAVATAICCALQPHLAPTNLIMIYLAGVALVASRYGSREAILASILCVAAFDWFFAPPFYTFAVSDSQYLLSFSIMLAVALLISGLSQRLRRQLLASTSREQRTASLYTLSRELAKTRSKREIGVIAARDIGRMFDAEVVVMLKEDDKLGVVGESAASIPLVGADEGAANWALEKAEPAGAGTDTLANASAHYVPLVASRGVIGVLGVKSSALLDSQQESLLHTFANGLAMAFERTLLAKESHQSRLAAETEKTRNVLLNSVSHDLRTPLTVIHVAASAIAQGGGDAKSLADSIMAESERLNRHVQNLLDMTRLEASAMNPKLEWHSIEELLGAALAHTEKALQGREIKTFVPPGLQLIKLDGVLVEKALVNLFENIASHTAPGTPVAVRVSTPGQKLRVAIEDRGPGIPKGEEEKVFDKFYQPSERGDVGGYGLGLAICHSIAEAHGGKAWVENRAGGGARFVLEFAVSGSPPEIS